MPGKQINFEMGWGWWNMNQKHLKKQLGDWKPDKLRIQECIPHIDSYLLRATTREFQKKEHGTWGRLSMKRTDWNRNALGDTIRYLIKCNGKCMLLVLCKSLLKREDFSNFQLGCLWVRLIYYPFSYHFYVTIQFRDGQIKPSHPILQTKNESHMTYDNHMIQLVQDLTFRYL